MATMAMGESPRSFVPRIAKRRSRVLNSRFLKKSNSEMIMTTREEIITMDKLAAQPLLKSGLISYFDYPILVGWISETGSTYAFVFKIDEIEIEP